MSYYLDQIKDELEYNNTLPRLAAEVDSISDDLFASLDGATFVPEHQQAVEKILTHIRKKKTDIASRDTTYKTNLQNIADSTAALAVTGAGALRKEARRKEQDRLTQFQAKQAELDRQFYTTGSRPTLPTPPHTTPVPTPDVNHTISILEDIENKYKNLYQHYRKYKSKNDISKTIKHKTSSTIKSADDIFHVIPSAPAGAPSPNTFTKKIQKVTIGDKEYTDNITINGIDINSISGDISISDNLTIKIKGKKISRDQDIKLSYDITATTDVIIQPGTPTIRKNITYKQPYTLTLQADPKLASKREEKEKQANKKKQEKENKQKGEGKVIPLSSSSFEKREPKETTTRKQKLKNLVSGTSHTAATVLSAPITVPIEGTAALGKMGVQAVAGTANHVIIGGVRDTLDEFKWKKFGPQSNAEAFWRGATLGILPGLKTGRGLTKGIAKTGRRTLEMLSSVWGKGRRDVKTSGKRKRDYSLANKKGFRKRGGETMNQVFSGRSPNQPHKIDGKIIPLNTTSDKNLAQAA